MRRFITERNLVIVLFVMVIITFSFAERDTKKIEHLYVGEKTPAASAQNKLDEQKMKTLASQTSTPTVILKIAQ